MDCSGNKSVEWLWYKTHSHLIMNNNFDDEYPAQMKTLTPFANTKCFVMTRADTLLIHLFFIFPYIFKYFFIFVLFTTATRLLVCPYRITLGIVIYCKIALNEQMLVLYNFSLSFDAIIFDRPVKWHLKMKYPIENIINLNLTQLNKHVTGPYFPLRLLVFPVMYYY